MRRYGIIVLGALLILAPLPASAADFDAKIVNLDGSPPRDETGKEIELTVGTVCVNALLSPMPPDEQAGPDSGAEKMRRTSLAERIQRRDQTPLTAEETALVKKLVNRTYPLPLIVTQTWQALEKR